MTCCLDGPSSLTFFSFFSSSLSLTALILSPSLTQVDIGQGWKAPGYYIQRSSGLFPAPYPQNSPEVGRLCKLFELLGTFIAKCIQDKRRVDLPLARPLFKIMSVSRSLGERLGRLESPALPDQTGPQQTLNNQQPPEDRNTESSKQHQQQQVSNMHRQSHSRSPAPSSQGQYGVGGTGATKEAELQLLVAGKEEGITKDSAEKEKEEVVLEEVGEREGQPEPLWFEGILGIQDLEEVSPFR